MIGELNDEIIEAIFETMPLEISVIGADDKVLAWNRHETRIFKRSKAVVGRNVRDCHPKKSLDKVEQILQEMKDGERDKARFWINMMVDDEKAKILIEYFALRNSEGDYLGCLESSQEVSDIQRLKGEKRLLD